MTLLDLILLLLVVALYNYLPIHFPLLIIALAVLVMERLLKGERI